MSPQSHSISYGKHDITFTLLRVNRKTMEISVHPDMSVIIKAPQDADISKIEMKVKKRARWILKQKAYFNQFHPRITERYYLSGETHYYLGKQYQLKVIKSDNSDVKLKNGYFIVYSIDGNQSDVYRLMQAWYRKKAKEQFTQSFNRCWKGIFEQSHHRPNLQVKVLKKRWGSLSPGGILTLNLELIKAPKDCIDYVITHELCHLIYPNHNKEFYQLLEELIPNWEKIKHKLEVFMS